MGKQSFGEGLTILHAESVLVKEKLYAMPLKEDEGFWVIREDDFVEVDPKIIMPAVLVDRYGFRDHERELYRKSGPDGPKPPDEKLATAKRKDQDYVKKVMEARKREFMRVGLKPDLEIERVMYYKSGEAKMKVIECLDGNLKKGDEITVFWKNLRVKQTCPHLTPSGLGKHGVVIEGEVKNGQRVALSSGFLNVKEAYKIKKELDEAEKR